MTLSLASLINFENLGLTLLGKRAIFWCVCVCVVCVLGEGEGQKKAKKMIVMSKVELRVDDS